MKKFVSMVLVIALLLSAASVPLVKSGSSLIVIKLWVGSPYMEVNGLRQPIDAEGTKPVIVESRTLVPIRAIIEAFGGNVGWSLTDKKVTISFNGNILELTINKPTAYLNGFAMPIDPNNSKVVPQIIGGRTMVPLRFVAESFGIGVDYDSKTKQITLTYTLVTPPNSPVLISPSNGAVVTDTNITFSWMPVGDADYYKISINSNGVNVYLQDKVSSTSIIVSQQALGTGTFTWQVAAHNSAGWGQFSTSYTFSISVQVTIPQPPTLISPISDTVLKNYNITFNWTSVSGADSYKLQITKDNSVIYSLDTISTNTFTLSGIELQSGNYVWQVAAHNSAGWSDWSLPGSFILQKQLTTGDIAKFVDRVVYIEAETADGTIIGTGFIISSDGKILTNYHVIEGATSGTATLSNNSKYNIDYVLGYSKPKDFGDKDLAVIKINATNLPVCTLGDSDRIQVGDKVVTIGNPLGIQNVVSEGIISKIWETGLIQITAPISPGNSGGPLFNMDGEVIGINTFQYAKGQNLNVALPINWLKSLDISLTMTLLQVYQKEYENTQALPAAPKLISPSNGAVLTTTTPTLFWDPVQNIDYYIVGIYENTVNSDSLVIAIIVKDETSYSVPSGKLKPGNKYFWTVLSHNASGYNSPNDLSLWTFTISEPQQISSPSLLSPKEGDSISDLEDAITFTWSPIQGVDRYILWIGYGLSGSDSSKIYEQTVTSTSATLDISTFIPAQLYTWAVAAIDASGNSKWSLDRHFSVVKTGQPIITLPTTGSISYGTFMWSSYPSLESNETYVVLISDSNGNTVYFDSTTINFITVSSSYFTMGKKYSFAVSIVYSSGSNSYILYLNFVEFYYGSKY